MERFDETYASNPGYLKVSYIKLTLNKPKWPLIFGVPILVFLYLYTMHGVVWYLIPLGIFSLMLGIYYDRTKQHFRLGDVNISKVISVKPPVIAVSTNMETKAFGKRFPVIKVLKRRVPRAKNMRWEEGSFFASACLYRGALGNDHWDDFFPFPLSFATSDTDAIREHETFLEYLHDDFDQRYDLAGRPKEPGLYYLDPDKLDWPDG